ncbi:MAG TPA: cytochrome c oxidase subunit 3 [Microvirga sp.]|jgi:cytochrome c oxidase subunit III|nr:cytochrome c oxidase subunit 3 [Microvirga sp.]
MRQRPVLDVSKLPDYGYGPRSPVWWGTVAFCILEGTGFVVAIGGYLYLTFVNQQWPLSAPPLDLLWSSILTAVAVASVWPNWLAKRNGEREDLRKVRRDLVVMSVLGIVLIVLRVFEIGALPIRWDQNAYGSMVWMLLGLHTAHIVTDVIDTIVLTVLMFTRHGHGKRFSDVSDNAFYWNFVVLSWPPIYVLLYWTPRL